MEDIILEMPRLNHESHNTTKTCPSQTAPWPSACGFRLLFRVPAPGDPHEAASHPGLLGAPALSLQHVSPPGLSPPLPPPHPPRARG